MSSVALRPLGVGDIVDRVLALYRAGPLLLVTLSAIPYLLLALLATSALLLARADLGALASAITNGEFGEETAQRLIGLAPYFAFIGILSIVLFSVQSAALVHAIAARYLGRATTLSESLRAGLSAAPRVIGAGLLAFIILVLLPLTIILITALTQSGPITAIGVVVAIVAVAYVALSYVAAPMAATLEGAGPVAALRRSFNLVRGARRRALLLLVLLAVLQAVLSSIFSVVLVGALFADDIVRVLVQQGIDFLVGIFWAPLQWGTFTVFYYDLRVRKEAFDLQLAAEALPRGG